jgi:hypothetical protein
MKVRLGPRLRLFLWMVVIAGLIAPVAYGLVGIAYSRVVYLFIVGPILAVLWFPMGWAANRWLTPLIAVRFRRT